MTNAPNAVQPLTYEQAFAQVNTGVERLLTKAPRLIREYTAHLAQSRGKMVRAHALLASSETAAGIIPADAVRFASAIELLHLATLVHDDVIDDAPVRRGSETLQKRFGKRTAVICGDYLLSMALRHAASVPEKEPYLQLNLPDYVGRVCLGELLQSQNNGNLFLTGAAYLKIIAGKTAALFELAFFAGSLAHGGDCASEANLYRRFGRLVGMIFQLTDDCIDFEAPERLAKKPVQSDFEHGVVTLPLIQAFETQPNLRQKAQEGTLTREEINLAVVETGGISFTRFIAKRYYDKASRVLEQLRAHPEKKERLLAILERAYRGLKH